MKNHKLIAFSLASALVLLLSSCGAPSVALLFCWIRTVEHDAEYFKVEKNGGTAERKTDEDKMDIKNGSFSVFSSISSRGEKFKYEFPNTMHETKGAPYGISLRIENTSGTIDFIQLKKAAVSFRESEKDLLGAMVYSDNSEKRNFVITSDKIYGEHHSSYGPASKKRHKSFPNRKNSASAQKTESSRIRRAHFRFRFLPSILTGQKPCPYITNLKFSRRTENRTTSKKTRISFSRREPQKCATRFPAKKKTLPEKLIAGTEIS